MTRVTTNGRPLHYRSGIQPMGATDTFFWAERRRRKQLAREIKDRSQEA